MKAEILGFLSGRALATISGGADEMKTIDQLPGTGNWTSPTLRNWLPDWLKMVSNTCFKPLWTPRTSGVRSSIASPNRTSERPMKLACQEPEQSKPDHRNEDAEARNVERKIAVGRQ